jgi:hypothetical protein
MPQKSQKDEGLVNPSGEDSDRQPSQEKTNGSRRGQKSGIEVYADWFASLPLPEQQALLRQGLGPEAREGDGNYTFEVNPDHSAYATLDPQYNDYIEPEDQRTYTEDEVQEVIRRIVMAMQMSESPDCLFQARCILIAFGIGDPPTETELAKQKDCSRQFVSKKVKRIQQMFNLSPSQFMRSEAACHAYSLAWQRQKERSQTPREPFSKSRSNASSTTPRPTNPPDRPKRRYTRRKPKQTGPNEALHTTPTTQHPTHLITIPTKNYTPPPTHPPTPLPPRKESIKLAQNNTGSVDTAPSQN